MRSVRRLALTPLGLAALALCLVVLVLLTGRLATEALSADIPTFDAGYLATVAGIAVGVPIAVAVALWQQRLAQDEDRDAQRERRAIVLKMIGDDLADTRAALLARVPDRTTQSRDIGSSVSKCRVLLDEMVQQEWLTTFAADTIPPYRNFNDLARDLDGQAGVDVALLALKRTMYRLCNPGAHKLGAVPPRRGAIILLTVVSMVAATAAKQDVA